MIPRVAFFTDCFHEVNGVALTSRQFAQFAKDTRRPFLTVHGGPTTEITNSGSLTRAQFGVGKLSVGLERDLCFDVLFQRHLKQAEQLTSEFGADLIHLTSPGQVGLLGARVARRLRLPVVASWHTNVHEYCARRLRHQMQWCPAALRDWSAQVAEDASLSLALQFYARAELLFAPNPELVAMLHSRTGLPCFLMERGIDVETFSPRHRTRQGGDFIAGFVGRLSVEKNIRLLANLYQQLRASGLTGFRFIVVGDGSEREWLRANVPGVELPGVLRGPALAEAYANMDVFVFPSETDTYGNVIQEALASGVPCVVSAHGGPKFLVEQGATGFIASTPTVYAEAVARLIQDVPLRRQMSSNARQAAEGRTWEAVFEGVYARYEGYLYPQTKQGKIVSSNLHQKYNIR